MTTKAVRAEARETLLNNFRIVPGETVYTVLRSRSRSGMQRKIDLYLMRDGTPVRITYSAAQAIDARYDRKTEALVVGECGYDVGHHTVYSLSRVLFAESGFTCIGEKCPSNDHSNGDRNREPHKHTDHGYALRHEWI